MPCYKVYKAYGLVLLIQGTTYQGRCNTLYRITGSRNRYHGDITYTNMSTFCDSLMDEQISAPSGAIYYIAGQPCL